MAIAVHRTVDGRSLGGLRFKAYDAPGDALADVERLAQAMTFKAAVSRLRLGGAKGVIACPVASPPDPELRKLALHDFAELVDSFEGRYITAQDAGTSIDDISYLGQFTDQIAGHPLSEGGSGDPSPYTAHGVEVAIRTTIQAPLAGHHVVIVGLGHVGSELTRRLHDAGVRLTVADVDPTKLALARRLGAECMAPEDAILAEADVLAPCALGGVLDEGSVPTLQCPVVAGAANNQLADESVADLLDAHGVLWAPDFVANAGGIINISVELENSGYDPTRARRRVLEVGDTLREIYDAAGAGRLTPLTAAMELARRRLAEGHG
jgi:leucine dehydrogenase